MGFKSKISAEKRIKGVAKRVEALETVMIEKLYILGEKFVDDARSELSRYKYIEARYKDGVFQTKSLGGKFESASRAEDQKFYYRDHKKYIRRDIGGTSFSDWTSNLRNSIGYFIFRNADLVKGNIGQGVGATAAEQLAMKVAAPLGVSIVFTAGMGYAQAVEAKGYAVITDAARKALKNLKKELEDLQRKIKNKV